VTARGLDAAHAVGGAQKWANFLLTEKELLNKFPKF
jgi:hypothetical protein